jgi:hypothetical protein
MNERELRGEPMTPFERRLVAALHAYADEQDLLRPAKLVATGARMRRRTSSRWLIPSGVAAAILIVAAGIAGINALNGSASSVPSATVDGHQYGIANLAGITIRPEDLRPVGRITETNASEWFGEGTAYAFPGLDPQTALVVAASAEVRAAWASEYLLLWRVGFAFTDLCPLYDAGGAPAICVRASPQQQIP